MWKDLSMSQRAEVIQLAIKNGMRDLNQIRSFYDDTIKRFDKGGKISDEEYYATMEKVAEENNPIWNKQRIAEGGKPLSVEEDLIRILNDNSYDYRGFYNKYPPTAADANSHWTDEFKTAYHPLFSDQSKFSGKKSQYNPYGYRGGHWVEETFFPEIWQTADSNKFPDGGPKETYNVGYIPEVTIEAERKNNPYIYYDPWSGRYKGIGVGGQRIEYGEGFNPEGSILLPNAQAYENQRLIRAKQDDLSHTNAFANTIRNIALATTVAPMAGPLVEAAQAAAPLLAPGSKLWMSPTAKQLMASEIGGRAVDALFINGKTWGENLAPIVNEYTGWNPEETWWGKSLMEATNPGYFMSPTGLMSATGKAVDTAINTTKILSPRYRSLHAYNSINPVGYGSPVQRGLVWLDDMIKDNPVDLKRPLFYQRAIAKNKGVRPDEGYLRTGDYLEPTVKNRGQISDEARLDAWAIHNNLEPQYGTYIKTGDREYAYDIPKLMEKSESTLSTYKLPKGNEPGGKGMTDFVTGAGGGLTDFSLLGTDAHGNSLIHIEDLWDVNPFKRRTDIISRKLFPNWSSKYGDSLFTKGSRLYDFGEAHNSTLLRKIGDKMMVDSDEPLLGLLKPLDKKMQEFEVGTITGGKPFLMSTDVPVHAVKTPVHISDDFVLPMTTYKFGYNPNYLVDKSAFEPNHNTINLKDVDLGNLFDNIITNQSVQHKIYSPRKFAEGGPKKSITSNLHWLTRPKESMRDLALWGADVLGAPSHVTNAVRDISNRVANLPVIGVEAAYNRLVGNSDNWSDAFKEADTNPAPFFQAFEVFPMTNTESNYSDAQLENQYALREHSPGRPGQITHDGYRYINEGRYAGDVGAGNFFSPSKVNEWSIGQTAGVEDEEGNTYTSDLFAYDTKDTDNVYLKAMKEGKASPAMWLRGVFGMIGAKGYNDGTNSATAIRTKINTKAQKKAADRVRSKK